MRTNITALWAILAAIACAVGWVATAAAQPVGLDGRQGFWIHVVDRDVDAAFELVTADTGFTPMAVDATLMAAFDTTGYAGASSASTAKLYVSGIRFNAGSDSLRRVVRAISLAGGDTSQVNAGDTLSIFESAWLDTAVNGPILVFSDIADVRGSVLDTIAAGTIWNPKAHVFAGRDEEIVLDYVDAQMMSSTAVTCELRVYPSIIADVNYASDYLVAAVADSNTMKNGMFSSDFAGRGLRLGQGTYSAWLCKGGAANADVAVTLSGRRERR